MSNTLCHINKTFGVVVVVVESFVLEVVLMVIVVDVVVMVMFVMMGFHWCNCSIVVVV